MHIIYSVNKEVHYRYENNEIQVRKRNFGRV